MSKLNTINRQIENVLSRFYLENAALVSGQKVLIITDDHIDPDVAHHLERVAAIHTGNAKTYKLKRSESFPFEPPRDLYEKAMSSDLILAPTSFSLFHTPLIREACQKGAIFFSITGARLETLYQGAATANFTAIHPEALRKAEALTQAKSIKLTSDMGTDFCADITGRTGNAETSIAKKGLPGTFPDIEINTSIIEDTGNGRIVIDGSIGGIGILKKPLTLAVENGKIIEIEGGVEAQKLRSIIADTGDKNMYQIAEIGIGLNPNSSIVGVIIEDEATLGTAHIGIGNNLFMGGRNKAKSHMDLVLRLPKVYLDDRLVIDGTIHMF